MNNLKSTQSNNKKTRRKKKKRCSFSFISNKIMPKSDYKREREKKKRKQHKFGIELKRQLKYNNK